ncbi:GH32 C-terminal domain-containing protein [Photobacterium angustum]
MVYSENSLRILLKNKIEIYLDQFVIEVFINNGKHNVTSRFS